MIERMREIEASLPPPESGGRKKKGETVSGARLVPGSGRT